MNGYLTGIKQGTLGNVSVACKEGSTKKFKLEKYDNEEINGQENNSLEWFDARMKKTAKISKNQSSSNTKIPKHTRSTQLAVTIQLKNVLNK